MVAFRIRDKADADTLGTPRLNASRRRSVAARSDMLQYNVKQQDATVSAMHRTRLRTIMPYIWTSVL